MSSKTIIGIVVVIIVLAGGYFLFRNHSDQTAGYGTDTDGMDMTQTDTGASSPATTETAPSTSDTGTSATGKVVNVTVTGSNFAFAPKTISVNKGDTVNVHFVNSGGMHDFVIDEFNVRTATIAGGASADVSFVADKSGTFEYYCSVGTHRQMGMWGTLTVN